MAVWACWRSGQRIVGVGIDREDLDDLARLRRAEPAAGRGDLGPSGTVDALVIATPAAADLADARLAAAGRAADAGREATSHSASIPPILDRARSRAALFGVHRSRVAVQVGGRMRLDMFGTRLLTIAIDTQIDP